MLRIENASLELGSKVLFRDLNFHLQTGQLLHIAGPNGIGKSSLLKALMGQVPLTKGSLHWNCKNKSYVPQLANMSFHINLTLRDVLNTLLDIYNEQSVVELGLLDSASLDLCWNSASGGERQRTLLTQAFLSGSDVLILDEPMNHLDKGRSAKVFELMKDFVSAGKRSLIYVSHNTFSSSDATTLNLRDCT